MEFIFEFLVELLLDGTFELSKSKKLSKWIRYPLILLVILFFIAVIGLILLTGILSINENTLIGITFIILAIIFLIFSILKFKEVYLLRR